MYDLIITNCYCVINSEYHLLLSYICLYFFVAVNNNIGDCEFHAAFDAYVKRNIGNDLCPTETGIHCSRSEGTFGEDL